MKIAFNFNVKFRDAIAVAGEVFDVDDKQGKDFIKRGIAHEVEPDLDDFDDEDDGFDDGESESEEVEQVPAKKQSKAPKAAPSAKTVVSSADDYEF